MDYTDPQRYRIQKDRPLQQPHRISPWSNPTSPLHALERARERRNHSENRGRDYYSCKVDAHRQGNGRSSDTYAIDGFRVQMVCRRSLRGQGPQISQRDIHKARSAGDSPETIPSLSKADKPRLRPSNEENECEQSSQLLPGPSKEETDAYIVPTGPQGLGLPSPSPDLANPCRFLDLVGLGPTIRRVDPRPAEILRRATWRGVPCERLGEHSLPLHLVSVRQHAASIVLW